MGDAKKVKTSGTALKEGSTHADNTFNVDTRNAGYGGLSLSIEGPSKAEIKCQDKDDGTLDISYTPTEPGYYIVNLKFADHHVRNCCVFCEFSKSVNLNVAIMQEINTSQCFNRLKEVLSP